MASGNNTNQMKSNNSELAGAYSIEKSVGSSVYVSILLERKRQKLMLLLLNQKYEFFNLAPKLTNHPYMILTFISYLEFR